MKTRAQLDDLLLDLEANLPHLLAHAPQADRVTVFTGQAESIECAARPEDSEYVSGRLHALVEAYGLAA